MQTNMNYNVSDFDNYNSSERFMDVDKCFDATVSLQIIENPTVNRRSLSRISCPPM